MTQLAPLSQGLIKSIRAARSSEIAYKDSDTSNLLYLGTRHLAILHLKDEIETNLENEYVIISPLHSTVPLLQLDFRRTTCTTSIIQLCLGRYQPAPSQQEYESQTQAVLEAQMQGVYDMARVAANFIPDNAAGARSTTFGFYFGHTPTQLDALDLRQSYLRLNDLATNNRQLTI